MNIIIIVASILFVLLGGILINVIRIKKKRKKRKAAKAFTIKSKTRISEKTTLLGNNNFFSKACFLYSRKTKKESIGATEFKIKERYFIYLFSLYK